MDESESLGNDPVWLLVTMLAQTALRQGNLQLAYLLDTSRGDICRWLRSEADDLGRFLAQMSREPPPRPLAA